MYKEDLALNSLQRLICHKTQPTQATVRIPSIGQIDLFKKYIYTMDHLKKSDSKMSNMNDSLKPLVQEYRRRVNILVKSMN